MVAFFSIIGMSYCYWNDNISMNISVSTITSYAKFELEDAGEETDSFVYVIDNINTQNKEIEFIIRNLIETPLLFDFSNLLDADCVQEIEVTNHTYSTTQTYKKEENFASVMVEGMSRLKVRLTVNQETFKKTIKIPFSPSLPNQEALEVTFNIESMENLECVNTTPSAMIVETGLQ